MMQMEDDKKYEEEAMKKEHSVNLARERVNKLNKIVKNVADAKQKVITIIDSVRRSCEELQQIKNQLEEAEELINDFAMPFKAARDDVVTAEMSEAMVDVPPPPAKPRKKCSEIDGFVYIP